MTILLESSRLLFLGVPGTASTSIEQALEKVPGARWVGPKHSTLPFLVESGALTASDASTLSAFCVVRNPYDIVYAEWHRSRTRWVLELDDPSSVGGWGAEKRKMIKMSVTHDFSEFVESYFGSAYERGIVYDTFSKYTDAAARVFKFEALDKLVEWLKEEHNVEIKLLKVNSGTNKLPYWRAYSARAREMVSSLYRKDIETHNYLF